MAWAELKRKRAIAVAQMQDVLDGTEPLGLNAVLVFLLGLPVIMWQVLRAIVTIGFEAVVAVFTHVTAIFLLPFIYLYLIIDITLISIWYLKRISIRTSEEPK